MGTLIQNINNFNTFVIDLEYIGVPNDLERCYIWEIGAVHLLSGRKFSVTIDPEIRPLPPPISHEFANVTDAFLKKKAAVPFQIGWSRFIQFIQSFGMVLLISHNNFKSDKLMLEIEAKRRGVTLPYTWYFLDSLLFCRKAVPKQASYTLQDIYYSLLRKRVLDSHSALPDAIALSEILYYIGIHKINGPVYPSYSTSLQVVKWLGPACERALFGHNIRSLEQLITGILSNYSQHILQSGIVPVNHFVKYYINTLCGATNSESISKSITEKWLYI